MKGRKTMNWKKKLLALGLSLALTLSLTACGQKAAEPEQSEEPAQTEEPVVEAPDGTEADIAHFRIAALKGPTAMGLVKLMKDNDETIGALLSSAKPYEGEVGNLYTFTLAGSADEVTPALIKGDLDMACVPANLAAVLYGKTGGAVEVLAVNTLGVLYIVENGGTVQSMADLKGQTIVAAGKGSTPEYALRYLLTENGIDPDKDVTIDWKSEHSECVAALASGQATIALLPQPFVTVAQTKIEGLRMALDLTAEWDKLDGKTILAAMEKKDSLDAELKKLAEEYEHEHHDDDDDDAYEDIVRGGGAQEEMGSQGVALDSELAEAGFGIGEQNEEEDPLEVMNELAGEEIDPLDDETL